MRGKFFLGVAGAQKTGQARHVVNARQGRDVLVTDVASGLLSVAVRKGRPAPSEQTKGNFQAGLSVLTDVNMDGESDKQG